jgi:hypothetical protein
MCCSLLMSIDTALRPITDVFDFYSRDLAADSGHTLIIGETRYALNYSKLDLQTLIGIGGYVPIADISSLFTQQLIRSQFVFRVNCGVVLIRLNLYRLCIRGREMLAGDRYRAAHAIVRLARA